MPVSKKNAAREQLARTHAMVSSAVGGSFRIPKNAPDRQKIAESLKELEGRGLVLFVPGVGWVDSAPAIARYQRATGLAGLLGWSETHEDVSRL